MMSDYVKHDKNDINTSLSNSLITTSNGNIHVNCL